MSFEKQPDKDHGFIYILSNASMPGVYKVGLTTNSVRQRAQELASTGVPSEFRAEKIFQIDQKYLRQVEYLSHKKLKELNHHEGKEFFRAPIHTVFEVVEDTIFEITQRREPDLVGLAARRAADIELRRRIETLKQENHEIALQIAGIENSEKIFVENEIRDNRIKAEREADQEYNEKIKNITIDQTGDSGAGQVPFYIYLFTSMILPGTFFVAILSNGLLALIFFIATAFIARHLLFTRPSHFYAAFEENINSMTDLKNKILQEKLAKYSSGTQLGASSSPQILNLRSRMRKIREEIDVLITSQSGSNEASPTPKDENRTEKFNRASPNVHGIDSTVSSLHGVTQNSKLLRCPTCKRCSYFDSPDHNLHCKYCEIAGIFSPLQEPGVESSNFQKVTDDKKSVMNFKFIQMVTTKGNLVIELFPNIAPKHVERIRTLIRLGFYNNTIFHRVIDGFIAQGGDPTGTGTGMSELQSLPAEFVDPATECFTRGTCGMARTEDPNSANSQFFITLARLPSLDGQYTIWGRVISGMEVVDKLKRGGTVGVPMENPDRIITVDIGEYPHALSAP